MPCERPDSPFRRLPVTTRNIAVAVIVIVIVAYVLLT
jgi:uncharacterized protein YggT (Ycf19 family)